MTYKTLGLNRTVKDLVKTLEEAERETGIPHHMKVKEGKVYIEAEEIRFPKILE